MDYTFEQIEQAMQFYAWAKRQDIPEGWDREVLIECSAMNAVDVGDDILETAKSTFALYIDQVDMAQEAGIAPAA